MSEPQSDLIMWIAGGVYAVTAFLFKRELLANDKSIDEMRKAIFGHESAPGLREKVSSLDARAKSHDDEIVVIFKKLDRILEKLEALLIEISTQKEQLRKKE